MKIFLVIGAFGDGGITTAMFNRAAMFTDAGHECAIIHLDYRPDFEAYIEEMRDHGRLRNDVEVLSPFNDAMKSASTRLPIEAPTRPDLTGQGIVRYYSADDQLLRKTVFDAESRLRTLDVHDDDGNFTRHEYAPAGSLERLTTYVGGAPSQERYFTPEGRRYLTRTMDPKTGSQVRIETAPTAHGYSEVHQNNTKWHTAWMESLATAHPGQSVFICDGPGSASKVINIQQGVAGRVVVLHDNHYAKPPYKPGSAISARTSFIKRIASFDALVVLTEEQRADVIADVGHESKVQVIPNTIIVPEASQVQRESMRVSMFGKLIDRKDPEAAVRAFQRVVQALPDASLHIYGAGPQEGPVRALIAELGMERNVHLEGYTNDAGAEMAKASAVMFPSKSEAWGFTIAESLLNESPVVSFACKYGPSDLIENGVDGYLVPVGDIEAMADRIVHVLEHPDEARAMGSAGRKKIEALYTREPLMERWEKLLNLVT